MGMAEIERALAAPRIAAYTAAGKALVDCLPTLLPHDGGSYILNGCLSGAVVQAVIERSTSVQPPISERLVADNLFRMIAEDTIKYYDPLKHTI